MAIDRIAPIVGSEPLARAIHESLQLGLQSSAVLGAATDSWAAFTSSLQAAIRDVDSHPLGRLFQRLIRYGPPGPDDPPAPTSDGTTILSDPETATCVEFIYSHMVNRFKGELAEMLAVRPVVHVVQRQQRDGHLPADCTVYFADAVQERRAAGATPGWGALGKGADAVIAASRGSHVEVHGVVEVKSMRRSVQRIAGQLHRHLDRLGGGVRLGGTLWDAGSVRLRGVAAPDGNKPLLVMVIPSDWHVDRDWRLQAEGAKQVMRFPEPPEPQIDDEVDEISPGIWRIRLAWSQEALEQAAYEMTYWYMSQVGRNVYQTAALPQGWQDMSPSEAGYNAIKMMLYFVPLRVVHLDPRGLTGERLVRYRQSIYRKAVRLYNVYCFGYALAKDSTEMLWPEDLALRSE